MVFHPLANVGVIGGKASGHGPTENADIWIKNIPQCGYSHAKLFDKGVNDLLKRTLIRSIENIFG